MSDHQTTKPRRRHDLFVWREVDRIIRSMEFKGLALHFQYRWYGPHWWLSSGEHLDREVAEAVVKDPRVVSVGDSLFPGEARGQTWRFCAPG